MKYYRMEGIHRRNKEQSRPDEGIQVGDISAVESMYLGVDPKTNKVHSEIHVESIPRSATFFDYNNTSGSYRYKKNDQLPLFHTIEHPGTFHVLMAFGTERGRTHAMNLLATAKARNEKFVGPTEVSPSPDLSPHSFKVVQNLTKRGLLNPSMDYGDERNDSDFWSEGSANDIGTYAMADPSTDFRNYLRPKEVPTEDIKAGKEELRRFLGRTPKPKSPPVSQEQFEQLQLDGF